MSQESINPALQEAMEIENWADRVATRNGVPFDGIPIVDRLIATTLRDRARKTIAGIIKEVKSISTTPIKG